MNMTNREESSAAEHETYPGPGPLKTDEAKRGIRPVEQMVDAAIERIALERSAVAREAVAREAIARETAARAGNSRSARGAAAGPVVAEPGQALTLARADAAALVALGEEDASRLSSSPGSQLALASDARGKGRLRWKGLDVSDEFRSYAERVARGEDLPPFAGKILAEPDPAFPWDPTAQKRAARRALKQQIGLWLGVAAFLGLSVAVLIVQVRKQTDAWQPSDSPLATVTMTNQPSAVSESGASEAVPAVAENAPAAFNEPGLEASSAASAAPPVEQQPAASSASPPSSGVPSSAVPSSPPVSAALPRTTVAAKLAPATPSTAGVLVATRAAATPASAGMTASHTSATSAATAELAVKAVGTGGTPAGSSVTAATDVTGAGDSASALRADPKKEPTREASGMGSLLVESPSF